jgi:hypothetical protein
MEEPVTGMPEHADSVINAADKRRSLKVVFIMVRTHTIPSLGIDEKYIKKY